MSTPTPETRAEDEVRETLADALAIEGLEALLAQETERRREELISERRSMKQQLAQVEGSQSAEWLEGIDDLAPGSFDLLTVTVLWPD